MIGLINIQYAVARGELYVIEANPRASRTIPFVSKAIGAPLAKVACRLMLGEKLADQDIPELPTEHVSVKEAVLPFARFAGADAVLGPEMKSTGEVMGVARDFPTAFAKAQAAAGVALPLEGSVFITVTDDDKAAATQIASRFHDLGFEIIATRGTAQAISRMGIPVRAINKIAEGSPHVVDFIRDEDVDLVINTPTGSGARSDGYEIRNAAVRGGVPCITTMTGASAVARAIHAVRTRGAEPQEPAGASRRSGATAPPRGLVTARVLAPFGARTTGVVARRETGGYVVFTALDAEGPDPAPGQFYMLSAEGWGSDGGRPFLPRAFSVAAAERTAEGRAPRVPGRGGRARHGAPGSARAGRRSSPSPARSGARSPSRARSTPERLARSSSAAESASPRSRSCAATCSAEGIPMRTLLGLSRRGALGRPRALRRLPGGRTRLRGRAPRSPGLRHRSPPGRAQGRRRGRGRRVRVRTAGDARGGPPDLRRPGRAGGARDGVADGVRLRRLLRLRRAARRAAATCASASTGRSSGPTRSRPRSSRDRGTDELRDRLARARAPGPERLGHLRRDRGSPGVRRRALRGLPVLSAFVSKTITPEPRAGNPPPRLYETPSGMINSIGLPNKGLEGFLAHDLPQLAELPVPLIVSVMATDRAGFERLVDGVGGARRGGGDRAQRLVPQREVGSDRRRAAVRDARAGHGASRANREAARREADAEHGRPRRRRASRPRRGEPTAVSLINTLRATAVAPGSAEPWLGAGSGGLSGPAVRAIALEQVRRVAAEVSICVIGMGGIETASRRRRVHGVSAPISWPSGRRTSAIRRLRIRVRDGLRDVARRRVEP